MLESALILTLAHLLHIAAYVLAFCFCTASLLIAVAFRGSERSFYSIIRTLLALQLVTNVFSAFSGIIRAFFGEYMPDQRIYSIFTTKMVLFGVSFVVVVISLLWFRWRLRLLSDEEESISNLPLSYWGLDLTVLLVNCVLIFWVNILGAILAL